MASWYPSEYYIQPHYITMPNYLRVEDMVGPTLSLQRRKRWTAVATAAFAEWDLLGVEVRFRPAKKPYGANRVTINLMDPASIDAQPDLKGWACFEECPPLEKPGSAYIHINPIALDNAFASRVYSGLKYLVAHEFGHSLGFGHGGVGIMDQTPEHAFVNAEEIEAAKAYWF